MAKGIRKSDLKEAITEVLEITRWVRLTAKI